MNKISVITVAHNEAEYLKEAWEQFKGLTDDFVLIDQASTDGTAILARDFTDKIFIYPRIYYPFGYIHQAQLLAKYDWVIKCDPDERWDANLIEYIKEVDLSDYDIAQMYMRPDREKNITLGQHTRLWRKDIIWTDSLDPQPYNCEILKWLSVHPENGYISHLRVLTSSRYRVEGAKRLLVRYGDTEVPFYKNICKYYKEIIEGKKSY